MEFRKVDGTKVNPCEYVKNYIKNNPSTKIMIGCDSQNYKYSTSYAVVIAMYIPEHGGHVIFSKKKTKRESNRQVRLLNEVITSLEVAEELRNSGITNIDYIDIDINPNPKYKSNEVFNQACGMVEGMGYKVRYKTLCPLVTTMADCFARH